MQYMILIYGDENQLAGGDDPQRLREAFAQYTQALHEAGVLRGGAELKPGSTATTVRVRGGKTLMTDGPFAETKEQLGGFYLIDVAHLDDATAWAARCPASAWGAIEVRPTGQTPDTL